MIFRKRISYSTERSALGIPLEYCEPQQPAKKRTLVAMICGVCSGPVAYALFVLVVKTPLPQQTKEFLGMLALIIVMGSSLIFGLILRLTIPKYASPRERLFANIGVAAPILWVLATVSLIAYIVSQLD